MQVKPFYESENGLIFLTRVNATFQVSVYVTIVTSIVYYDMYHC